MPGLLNHVNIVNGDTFVIPWQLEITLDEWYQMEFGPNATFWSAIMVPLGQAHGINVTTGDYYHVLTIVVMESHRYLLGRYWICGGNGFTQLSAYSGDIASRDLLQTWKFKCMNWGTAQLDLGDDYEDFHGGAFNNLNNIMSEGSGCGDAAHGSGWQPPYFPAWICYRQGWRPATIVTSMSQLGTHLLHPFDAFCIPNFFSPTTTGFQRRGLAASNTEYRQ